MLKPVDRFSSVVTEERRRVARQFRSTSLIAALIALLLYQTQWLSLRPGLGTLLAVNLSLAGVLLSRLFKLKNDLISIAPQTSARDNASRLHIEPDQRWFESQESFVRNLAFFEGAAQAIGFLTLGYGFWESTRSISLALAIGLIYPATQYLGLTRRQALKVIRDLRAAKQSLADQ